MARAVWLRSDQAVADAAITGQLPSRSGASISSQPSWVEPLGPEWPSWQQILASVSAWTKSTMRFHAASCSGAYMPVQPGVMRPSGADAGHLDEDQAGAALGALGVMHEMPVGRAAVDRLVLRHRRNDDAVLQPQCRASVNGANIGRRTTLSAAPAPCWNQASAPSSQRRSRSRRFSWLMRCERVSSE